MAVTWLWSSDCRGSRLAVQPIWAEVFPRDIYKIPRIAFRSIGKDYLRMVFSFAHSRKALAALR
jgi:hypothetical protein